MNSLHVSLIIAYLFGIALGSALAGTPPESGVMPESQSEEEPSSAGAALLGSCPGAGSCCVAHGSPGCDNTVCCESVCNAEPFCCFALWDADCASLARSICGSLCSGACPAPGDCCQSHSSGGCEDALCCDLVCTHTPSCCEAVWSATCANLAGQICEICEPPPLCPQPGDCCTARLTPGCERAACCATVCEMDAVCCTSEWDSVCAREARQNCPNVCVCSSFGNFDADPAIDLRDAAQFLNCFSGETANPIPAACACADYDGDGDSDLADFAVFVARLGTL